MATKKKSGAIADRQGRAMMPGKMSKNLPMIAPQSAYAKGGEAKKSAKPSAYDKMQDKKMSSHAAKPAKVAHKQCGGMARKSYK